MVGIIKGDAIWSQCGKKHFASRVELTFFGFNWSMPRLSSVVCRLSSVGIPGPDLKPVVAITA